MIGWCILVGFFRSSHLMTAKSELLVNVIGFRSSFVQYYNYNREVIMILSNVYVLSEFSH